MKLSASILKAVSAAALLTGATAASAVASGAPLAGMNQDTLGTTGDNSGAVIAGVTFTLAALAIGFAVGGRDDRDDTDRPVSP